MTPEQLEGQTPIPSDVAPELRDAASRAVRAGADEGSLEYLGAGMEGILFFDDSGAVYKVARGSPKMRGRLRNEYEALLALQGSSVDDHIPAVYDYDPHHGVLIREHIIGRPGGWAAESDFWDLYKRIVAELRAQEFTRPELKGDSFVIDEEGFPVFVDFGFAKPIGHRAARRLVERMRTLSTDDDVIDLNFELAQTWREGAIDRLTVERYLRKIRDVFGDTLEVRQLEDDFAWRFSQSPEDKVRDNPIEQHVETDLEAGQIVGPEWIPDAMDRFLDYCFHVFILGAINERRDLFDPARYDEVLEEARKLRVWLDSFVLEGPRLLGEDNEITGLRLERTAPLLNLDRDPDDPKGLHQKASHAWRMYLRGAAPSEAVDYLTETIPRYDARRARAGFYRNVMDLGARAYLWLELHDDLLDPEAQASPRGDLHDVLRPFIPGVLTTSGVDAELVTLNAAMTMREYLEPGGPIYFDERDRRLHLDSADPADAKTLFEACREVVRVPAVGGVISVPLEQASFSLTIQEAAEVLGLQDELARVDEFATEYASEQAGDPDEYESEEDYYDEQDQHAREVWNAYASHLANVFDHIQVSADAYAQADSMEDGVELVLYQPFELISTIFEGIAGQTVPPEDFRIEEDIRPHLGLLGYYFEVYGRPRPTFIFP